MRFDDVAGEPLRDGLAFVIGASAFKQHDFLSEPGPDVLLVVENHLALSIHQLFLLSPHIFLVAHSGED